MRRAVPAALAALLLLAAPASAREAGLWATVNVCDTPAHPAAMGVRVSMPAHGKGEQQWARVRVEWFDPGTSAWTPIGAGADSGFKRIGHGRGTAQGGTTFTFQAPAAGQSLVLRGAVDVQWRKRGRVKGRAKLPTESGHGVAKDRQLATSAATCEIKR